MYIYCIDEYIKNQLMSKNLKLINVNKNSSNNVYVFEYRPEQYSDDFFDLEIKNKCKFSNRLIMTF